MAYVLRAFRSRFRTVLAAVGLLTADPALALDYQGRDFVLAFLPGLVEQRTADGILPPRRRVSLQLASDVGATVTVEYPLGAPTFTRTVYVPAESVLTVELPEAASSAWPAGLVARNAVRASTSDPAPARFTVTLVNTIRFASDSGLALPRAALGVDYLTIMPAVSPVKAANTFVVAAVEDGTTVTITPTSDLQGGFPAAVPFVVTLDAGEGFYGRSDLFLTGVDLTGTSIVADRPVTVTNGDFCARIPNAASACDHVFEVAVPTTRWGRTVPVVPLPARPAGSIYRVVAAENGTTLSLNGGFLATLDRGDFVDTAPLTGFHLFTGDRPIAVMQMMTGATTAADGVFGDPATGNMLPVEDFAARHVFATVAYGAFDEHWMALIADAGDAAAGAVVLNGVPIPAAAFTPITGSAFAGTLRPLPPGTHHTRSPRPHHVTVAGLNVFDSYLHPVGERRGPDHFLCHPTKLKSPSTVTLADELGSGTYVAYVLDGLCAPADKNGEGVVDTTTHLTSWRLRGPDTPASVEVDNQFGRFVLDLGRTDSLLVPANKSHAPAPPPPAPDPADHAVDHYRCLRATLHPDSPRPPARLEVDVSDQFGADRIARIAKPTRLCVPTDKNHEGVRGSDWLLCFRAKVRPGHPAALVRTHDQLGLRSHKVRSGNELCLPTRRVTTDCCTPRPTRCRRNGVDQGPCDTPELIASCAANGGICQSVNCDFQCGNGALEPWCCEECDDGTRLDGDGCSATCRNQPCCIKQPTRCANDRRVPCDDLSDCARAGVGGLCLSFPCDAQCGNGTTEPWCCEECDDGEDCQAPCREESCTPQPCRCVNDPDTGCPTGSECAPGDQCLCYSCASFCGNGQVEDWCCEQCDDGAPLGSEYCTGQCRAAECNPQPCRCVDDTRIACGSDADCPTGSCLCFDCDSRCGDGTLDPWCCEECDDGTRLDGDGCSATCKGQPCCVRQPTRCANDLRVPCDVIGDDCARAGVGGPCISVLCDQRCGDGVVDPWCCEQCDDGDVCSGGPP